MMDTKYLHNTDISCVILYSLFTAFRDSLFTAFWWFVLPQNWDINL
jgi:hypothetical protein